MSIAEVIGWKFNHQPGMRCKEVKGTMTIIEFPGGVPSQADQDAWTQEHADWLAAGGPMDEKALELDDPKKAHAAVLELLWDSIPALRAAFPNPQGKSNLKQAAVSAYRDKL